MCNICQVANIQQMMAMLLLSLLLLGTKEGGALERQNKSVGASDSESWH
jgi:hypothetical protein